MAEVAAGCLDDPHVRLVLDDVGDAILLAPDPFDAILLDVDNGPDGVVREENNRLYSKSGLHNARKALVPGGILAVWSAFPDPKFTRRLQDVGFTVDEVEVRARYDANGKGKGPRHVIWFAVAD
jgi:spermidine synthase